MKKRIVAAGILAGLVVALVLLGGAHAEELDPKVFPNPQLNMEAWNQRGETLPFWEISPSLFEAQEPRPISLPKISSEVGLYWYWTFSFKVNTNLMKLETFLQKVVDKSENDAEKTFYEQQRKAVMKSVEKPLKLNLFICMHTDKGDIITDTSNPYVRNLIEKQIGGRYETVSELSKRTLKKGEVVRGVAIFPVLPTEVDTFEIRVYGLGRRFTPSYQPGELLYLKNTYNASIQRALRYSFRRITKTNDPFLDTIKLEKQESDWIWIWPSQVYAGKARTLDIQRPSGGMLPFRYVPYKIWNNTFESQQMAVKTSGIQTAIEWHGQPITLTFLDNPEEKSMWLTKAERAVRKRIADGEEETFVQENEIASIEGMVDEDAEKDKEQKSKLFPESGRHVAGTLEPGNVYRGVILVQWQVKSLQEKVDALVKALFKAAISNAAAGVETSDLVKNAYLSQRPAQKDDKTFKPWLHGKEPEKEKVIAALLKIAQDDLAAMGVEMTNEEKRLYGELAPIGALWNRMATKQVEEKAAKGVVDIFMEVKWDGIIDRCSFPCAFKRKLPKDRKPFTPPDVQDLMKQDIGRTEAAVPAGDAGGEGGEGGEGGGEEGGGGWDF